MNLKCSILHPVSQQTCSQATFRISLFLVDIPDALDKQASNVSPPNLWKTNDQSQSSLFQNQTSCMERVNMVVLISNAKISLHFHQSQYILIPNAEILPTLIHFGRKKIFGNLSIICHISPVANFWNNFTITVINHPYYFEPFLKYVQIRLAKTSNSWFYLQQNAGHHGQYGS